MKRIKTWLKINKKSIISFIIGGFIFSTLSVSAAILVKANEVSLSSAMTSETDVQGALDEIYDKIKVGDATEANISKGKTALVQGKLITGTGEDTIKVLTNFYTAGMSAYTLETGRSVAGYHALHNPAASYDKYTAPQSSTGESDHLYLYKTPDNKYGVITAISFSYSLSCGSENGTSFTRSHSLKVELVTENGLVLDEIEFSSSGTNKNDTVTWVPSDYGIDDGSEYIYIRWSMSASARLNGYGRVNAEVSTSDATAKYIPLE